MWTLIIGTVIRKDDNLKGLVRIVSIFMVMIAVLQGASAVLAATATKSPYTNYVYTHQSRFDNYEKINGTDVSQHNGTVDFEKVKAAGIDFVFVRVGFTGYTKLRFSLNYDTNYKTYIEDALDAGLAVGVYWYSQALNESEARQEAQKMLSVIKDYNITLPVVMDYEFADTSAGRLDSTNLSKSAMTNNALAFLSEVDKAGYDGCLYANSDFLQNNLNASTISRDYKIWLAHYTTNTYYSGDFDFWQYSHVGKVDGITGNADVNFWYYKNDDIQELSSHTYTGRAITPKPVVKDGDTVLREGTDYVLEYADNIKVGTAYVTARGINNYSSRTYRFKFEIKPDRAAVITIKKRTNTSLEFSWQGVTGAQTYYVYVKNNTNGNVFSKSVTQSSVTLSGLIPGNSYSVSVKAGIRNTTGEMVYGAYSAVNTKHTVADAVTGLKASARSKSSVTLTWNKKTGAAGYRIYRYYPSTKKYAVVADVNGYNSNAYTVKGLSTGETVYFRVSAFTQDSQKKIGYKSSQLTETTRPQTITVRSISSPSSKKVTLFWYRVNGSGYQVQWSTTKDFSSNTKSVTVAQNINKSTFTTYQSKRTYYFRMRSYKKIAGKTVYSYWSTTQVIKVK